MDNFQSTWSVLRIVTAGLFGGLGLLGLAAGAAEPVVGPMVTGPDWIQNSQVRVELFRSEASRSWRFNCRRRAGPEHEWNEYATATVVGTSTDTPTVQKIQKKWGVYYLFEKCLPQEVKTGTENGSAFLCFRLAREELWLDLKVSLLRDSEFIAFDCLGKSRPDLVPHGSLSLTLPLTGLAADKPGDPFGWQEINAREHRGEYVRLNWNRFAGVYRTGHPTVYFLLRPPGAAAQQLMFTPGGFGNVYLNYPYAFCATDYAGSRDAETIQHLGLRVYKTYRRAQ